MVSEGIQAKFDEFKEDVLRFCEGVSKLLTAYQHVKYVLKFDAKWTLDHQTWVKTLRLHFSTVLPFSDV